MILLECMLVWTPEMLWESASRLLTVTIFSLKKKAMDLLQNTSSSVVKSQTSNLHSYFECLYKVLLTTGLHYINSQHHHDAITKVEATCCPTEYTELILAVKTMPESWAYGHEMDICLVLGEAENPKHFFHLLSFKTEILVNKHYSTIIQVTGYLHIKLRKQKKSSPQDRSNSTRSGFSAVLT